MSLAAAKNAINRSIGKLSTCLIKRSGTKRGAIENSTSGDIFVYRNGNCVAKSTSGSSITIVFESGDGSWEGQLSTAETVEEFSVAQQYVLSELIRYINKYGPSVELTFEG